MGNVLAMLFVGMLFAYYGWALNETLPRNAHPNGQNGKYPKYLFWIVILFPPAAILVPFMKMKK
jgi:hypothetical protein